MDPRTVQGLLEQRFGVEAKLGLSILGLRDEEIARESIYVT